MTNDMFPMLAGLARDGARMHQLRFARERLEGLRRSLVIAGKIYGDVPDGRKLYDAYIADVDYAIAQIKAAEGV